MKCPRSSFFILLCALVLAGSFQHANAQEPQKGRLTNKDVLAMVALGLGDDVVIEKIRTAPETAFDTNMESLSALKAAHVSDAVILVMINPKASAATAPGATAAPVDPNVPDDVGVYLRVRGKLQDIGRAHV